MSDTGFVHLVLLTAGEVLSCFIINRNMVNFRHFWKPWVSISNLGFRHRPYEFLGFGFLRYIYIYTPKKLPVVPGQAGGGSFQKEKNYIAQKEFAYRMCARGPTSAMPKSFLCCERAFCRSMVVMFCALK